MSFNAPQGGGVPFYGQPQAPAQPQYQPQAPPNGYAPAPYVAGQPAPAAQPPELHPFTAGLPQAPQYAPQAPQPQYNPAYQVPGQPPYGQAPTAPVAQPIPGQAPVAAPVAPAPFIPGQTPAPLGPDQTTLVPITLAQYQALMAQSQANATAAQERENARLLALAETGKAKDALTAKDTEIGALNQTLVETVKTNTIAAGVSGTTFLSIDHYNDAMTLLAIDFQARRDPTTGAVVMTDKSGVPVTVEAIRQAVNGPRFAGFRIPSTQGGAPPANGRPPLPPVGNGQPLTPAQEAMANFRGQRDQAYGNGSWSPPVRPPSSGWGQPSQ